MSNPSRGALVAAGLAVSGLAAYQLYGWRRRRLCAERVAGHRKIALLPSERGPVVCMSPATSTITFFQGPMDVAAAYLAKRVAEIAASNPWLASVLDTDPETGEMAAFVPRGDRAEAAQKRLFANRKDIVVGFAPRRGGEDGERVLPYHAMVRDLAQVLCKPSVESVGTGAPLFSVTLVSGFRGDEFAVVASANHSLVDGHTFYRIHNMLCRGETVRALSPVRKMDAPARITEALGGVPSTMTACPPGFVARFVGSQMASAAGFVWAKTQVVGFYVNDAWVRDQKRLWSSPGSPVKRLADRFTGTPAKKSIVPFVSTNDCLVSAFANALRPTMCAMAANFRGKVSGLNDDDAGNYEDLIEYYDFSETKDDTKEDTPRSSLTCDYANPALIRRSVQGTPYARAVTTATLSDADFVFRVGKIGVTSNWSTFAKPLDLFKGSTQVLHVPILDWPKANPAGLLGSMLVFRPHEGRLAVMAAGDAAFVRRVARSGMAGEKLDVEF